MISCKPDTFCIFYVFVFQFCVCLSVLTICLTGICVNETFGGMTESELVDLAKLAERAERYEGMYTMAMWGSFLLWWYVWYAMWGSFLLWWYVWYLYLKIVNAFPAMKVLWYCDERVNPIVKVYRVCVCGHHSYYDGMCGISMISITWLLYVIVIVKLGWRYHRLHWATKFFLTVLSQMTSKEVETDQRKWPDRLWYISNFAVSSKKVPRDVWQA